MSFSKPGCVAAGVVVGMTCPVIAAPILFAIAGTWVIAEAASEIVTSVQGGIPRAVLGVGGDIAYQLMDGVRVRKLSLWERVQAKRVENARKLVAEAEGVAAGAARDVTPVRQNQRSDRPIKIQNGYVVFADTGEVLGKMAGHVPQPAQNGQNKRARAAVAETTASAGTTA